MVGRRVLRPSADHRHIAWAGQGQMESHLSVSMETLGLGRSFLAMGTGGVGAQTNPLSVGESKGSPSRGCDTLARGPVDATVHHRSACLLNRARLNPPCHGPRTTIWFNLSHPLSAEETT